ncbi:eukaryotic translation initiation factor 4 gamma 1-like [Thunnus maccoyii]|uniref:eukaryotic translation initiation factor 4 gamma 1-like n=1 Tax=Thunnus maccoyii TaxID=8240 RepID=UPI001C4AC29E|nr:eukaryotic translation initiation factor 4 gamma 1-like [Thunnus maccoyii]
MNMEKQKNMDVTFMLVPLNAAEKRKIKRRKVNGGEPVVFVEPSTSTRKRLEPKAPSEQAMRKNKGPSKNPVIFLDKSASTKTPEVNITFGCPSTQKKPVSGQCSASKKEVASHSINVRRQREPYVSGERSASKKEAKAASQQPAVQTQMRNWTKQRERKAKVPSEVSATLPRVTEKDKQIKPKEVISLVRTTLDHLTAETFKDLMTKLQNVTVDSEERLNSVINLIFEKAMSRPDSSALYANMCRCLTKMIVPAKDLKLPGSFQTLLIRRCQAEFVKHHGKDETFEQMQSKDVSLIITTTKFLEEQEEEHQRLRNELDNAEASSRSVSNIKFIAELFRLKMLSEAAVHSCMQRLLNNQDEESLECICTLLNSIGKELELLTPKKIMDSYFRKVADIIKQGKTSSRVSDLLKNIADLRHRNWIPECIDMDQIVMEDEHSGDSTNSLSSSSSSSSSSGHSTIHQTSAVVQLSSESAVCKEEPALPSLDADSSSANQHIQDSEESHPFDKQNDKQEDNSHPELNKEETRQTLSFTPFQHSLTEDEMEIFAEAIIDKYLRTDDLKEVLHIVSHLNSPSVLYIFVRNAVDLTFECGSRTRRQVGMLLLELVKSGALHTEQFFRGLKEILQVADYISTDVPEIWLCLAEVLSPVLHEGGISMAELFGEIQTLVPLGPAGVLLAHILTILSSSISLKTIKAMWNNAGVKWQDFLHSGDDIRKFTANWKVEYTDG